MATTNLLQWNPTAVNQENDAAYLADSQRAGGATNPSILQAELANKAFFQWSTFLTALFQAFANKGFTTSDSNLNTLTAACANFLTTADKIAVSTTSGGPLIAATQIGLGYGSTPSDAAFVAATQGNNNNYLYSTINNSGQVYFTVQAGGQVNATSLTLTGALQAASASISGAFSAASAAISGNVNAANVVIANLMQTVSALITGNLNTGSLQIGGTALNGQILTGDGTHYVPQPPPAIAGTTVDVTGSRAFGTQYQNTSNGVLFVSGYGRTSGSSIGSVQGLIGPGSANVPVWGNTTAATVNNGACGFNFTVPPGWFYQVNANNLTNGQGAAVTGLSAWVETTVTI